MILPDLLRFTQPSLPKARLKSEKGLQLELVPLV